MRVYYDCEFVEDGRVIDLVSIGMVAEDGRELYAVSNEFDVPRLQADPWLMANIWPHLPQFRHGRGPRCCHGQQHPGDCDRGHLNLAHPAVHSRATIASMVSEFINASGDVELWAWYGAYDHVALAQLWGRMIDLPPWVPMWTNDLKQECVRLGSPRVPVQTELRHHALGDARHDKVIGEFLRGLATR